MIHIAGLTLQQGSFRLDNLHFTVPYGAYAVLMGRSGSGKTTVLEVVCGLRPILTGRVELAGRDVTHHKPAERDVGYVPQDRALFPTFKVRDQLAFSLVLRGIESDRIAARVNELATLLEIVPLLDRMPHGLSGGEAQRVALGRALACEPAVLCLDEPLSALDEAMHHEICALLARIHRETRVTVLHITHSASEARTLGEHILRLENGQVTEVNLQES